MNLGAIFIGIAILIITVPYVMSPLVNERKRPLVLPASPVMDWRGEQSDALLAIRALDFDFQTGKVTSEDYETIRAKLVLEAAQYLQMKQQEDDKLEAMIRARIQALKPSVKCEKCGGEIRSQDLFCPACGVTMKDQVRITGQAAKINCPACGRSVRERDLFCTGCGTRVNRQAVAGNDPAER